MGAGDRFWGVGLVSIEGTGYFCAPERCIRLLAAMLVAAVLAAPPVARAQPNDVLDDAVGLAGTPPAFETIAAAPTETLEDGASLASTPPVFAIDVVAAEPVAPAAAAAQAIDPLDEAAALAETPPAFTADLTGPVNLLIAVHRTTARRYSDSYLTSGNKRRRPVAASMRLRRQDDANFTNRTRWLARRMAEMGRPAGAPRLDAATTGEEFLDALVTASRNGPIGNLVVYGHAAPAALFMREDRGFYASVMEVAKASQVVSGEDVDKDEQLRLAGARDLSDFEWLLRRGDIRFTRNAVIVFAGCGVAGKRDIDQSGIAARMAEITGARVIASIDVTDQSMGRGPHFRNHEYSRRTWVRFIGGEPPERLNTRVIDALKQMNFEGDVVAAGPLASLRPN